MVCHVQLRLFSIAFSIDKMEGFMTFIPFDILFMHFKLNQFARVVDLHCFLFKLSSLYKSAPSLSCARMADLSCSLVVLSPMYKSATSLSCARMVTLSCSLFELSPIYKSAHSLSCARMVDLLFPV